MAENPLQSVPLCITAVTVTDAFWSREQELVRSEVLPYQWHALNDAIPGAEPSYCIHNYRAAARLQQQRRAGTLAAEPEYTFRGFQTLPENPEQPEADQFYGFVFQDTDLTKWLEAVAYALARHPDPALERTADEAIALLCAAQQEDGYLDTYYILNGMDGAFTNLRDHHELYCLGHLIEGGVAYFQVTGKRALLDAACRFADCVARRFGAAPGQSAGYPGHELAELALARLYEATGEERYLRLSRFFLDARGTLPLYFDVEERERCRRAGKRFHPTTNPVYHQAHRPVREQTEAVGHAVRAMYLYSGMADVARLTGDAGLRDACARLWASTVREKLYITGGVGGTHIGESFSYPYDLPNDSAYSETCAAIGLVFFARRMLELAPRGEYADVLEQALYNTVLAGMSLDGRRFFYVNPLAVTPEACAQDARLAHVKPERQKWFGCACCPPNLARLIGSLGAYLATEQQDILWIHLYIGAELRTTRAGLPVTLTLASGLPWEGTAALTFHAARPVETTLAFRIPGWCCGESTCEAPNRLRRETRDGYLYLSGLWQEGDRVALRFPMPVLLHTAHTAVREDIGRVALTRGPFTYCLEEADNGADLHLLRLSPEALAHPERISVERGAICGLELPVLNAPGLREVPSPADGALYPVYAPPTETPVSLRLIPYFAWANRGRGELLVWVRR